MRYFAGEGVECGMTAEAFAERLIRAYEESYDITAPGQFGGMSFRAVGRFYAHQEKYILTREAQMWETNSFDYLFVLDATHVDLNLVSALDRMIRDHAEPELVRAGQKYPAKNHMYSDITVVVISSGPISKDVLAKLCRYHFSRSYLFTVRGWCDARMIAVDLAENRVYGNAKAKPLLRYYQKMLIDNHKEE